ncbi:MAG: gliding motility-associated C-terminal domain-containing protein [Williamsia sp.]|nr:gliding motility-associated C-terminal domain-containing protein [Williamsia sp.]
MKQNILYCIVITCLLVWGHDVSFAQCNARITHMRGDSLVECINVNVSAKGVVDTNSAGCLSTGPYHVGYNFITPESGDGSYTFTFTPAIHSLTLNFSGVSFISYIGKELVRLYVNGQHYKLSGTSQPSTCNPLAVLTEDGDLTGCDDCGAADWRGVVITGIISTLTIQDSSVWGYGNGTLFSLDICGNPLQSAHLGNDTSLCEGQTLLLDATTANATYLWQDGSSAPTFTVKDSGTYRVAISSSCGIKEDSIHVQYLSPPHPFLGNDTLFCPIDKGALLLNAYQLGSSYVWQDGSANPTLVVGTSEANVVNKYWVTVSNQCGRGSDTITVSSSGSKHISLGADTTLCTGSVLYLNAGSGNWTHYLWQDGSTQPAYTVTRPGTYQVTATDTCPTVSNTVTVHYTRCHCDVFLPTAFTPNSDGKNDRFLPLFDCDFTHYSLTIYNRWGQPVFRSGSNANAWDGMYKGQRQPAGTYTYVFSYQTGDGKRAEKHGLITLLR